MAPAVEVVGEAERVTAAEIMFERQVGLLRIRVHEILGLRISEGLETERQECGAAGFR